MAKGKGGASKKRVMMARGDCLEGEGLNVAARAADKIVALSVEYNRDVAIGAGDAV